MRPRCVVAWRPSETTTYEDEARRHGSIVGLLAREDPPSRKPQRLLDQLAELWTGPDHLRSCFGRVHWRVLPTAEEAAHVGRWTRHPSTHVRRAALVAISKLDAVPACLVSDVARCLGDEDVLVRMHAAIASGAVADREGLVSALARALEDPVWMVRWHAAVATKGTTLEAAGRTALEASEPRAPATAETVRNQWEACVRRMA
jgi:hypothetical protein